MGKIDEESKGGREGEKMKRKEGGRKGREEKIRFFKQ